MAARLRRRQVEDGLRTRRLGRNFIYRIRTASTMDDARAAALDGAPHGTVVFAEEQSAGRGRMAGRTWTSPAAQNLLFTALLRPDAGTLARLSLAAPVAVANAVEQMLGLFPRIKWPNDLHLRGKKFTGILIEAEWDGSRPAFALVGIGINVNFDPADHAVQIDRPATSLALERGRLVRREPLLAAVLNAFERTIDAATTDTVFRGWRMRLETLGRPLTLTNADGQEFQGLAEDVTFDGGLVVRLADGTLRTFAAAEVTTQGQRPVPRN